MKGLPMFVAMGASLVLKSRTMTAAHIQDYETMSGTEQDEGGLSPTTVSDHFRDPVLPVFEPFQQCLPFQQFLSSF
jgi:hypothetical protein